MDPRIYLSTLRRRWPVIVALAVLGGILAYVYESGLPVLYQSTASVIVSAQRGDTTSELVQGSSFAQANVQSYAQLATSPKVLQPVIDELGLQTTPGALAGSITADTPLNTVIIDVTATNPDAKRAAAIADAVTSSLSDAVEEISPTSADKTPAVKMTEIAPAAVARAPFSPNTRLIMLTGIVIGLVLGAVIALIWELLDTRIRSEKDLARVTDLPVLGSVARSRVKTPGWVAMRVDPHSIQAESYRRIRTNLEFADIDVPIRMVMVTSSSAGEGKSTTSLNLALAMSERMSRVLLIDADLRRPTIAERTGSEGAVGLTTVLLGKVAVEDAVQTYAGSVDILASGQVPHNPGQLLGSEAMSALLRHVAGLYDFIVIDTPPLLAATDTLGLAHATDGAIVVVQYKSTRRQQLVESLGAMKAVNARLLGIVLDRVDTPRTDSYYGYRPLPNSTSAEASENAEPELVGTESPAKRGRPDGVRSWLAEWRRTPRGSEEATEPEPSLPETGPDDGADEGSAPTRDDDLPSAHEDGSTLPEAPDSRNAVHSAAETRTESASDPDGKPEEDLTSDEVDPADGAAPEGSRDPQGGTSGSVKPRRVKALRQQALRS